MIWKLQPNNQLRLFVKLMHKLGTNTARKQDGKFMFWRQYTFDRSYALLVRAQWQHENCRVSPL